MKRGVLFWAFSLVSTTALFMGAEGRLDVLSEAGGVVASYDSCTLVHFSSGGDHVVEGPMNFVAGGDLCTVSREDVEGFIVISSSDCSDCLYSEVYDHLQRLGALGFVYATHFSPPGIFCFRRDKWDPHASQDGAAVALDVYRRGNTG